MFNIGDKVVYIYERNVDEPTGIILPFVYKQEYTIKEFFPQGKIHDDGWVQPYDGVLIEGISSPYELYHLERTLSVYGNWLAQMFRKIVSRPDFFTKYLSKPIDPKDERDIKRVVIPQKEKQLEEA